MALHRILVVHDSRAIRETVGIVLGADYEVQASRLDDYAATGIEGRLPHLIIAARASSGRCERRPFPGGVPVLWIDGAAEGPPGGWQGPSLPTRFSPRDLRRRVAELLAARSAGGSGIAPAARLHPPFVTGDAARAIAEALAVELPLHLVGEPGAGKRAAARAVHAARGRGRFLPLPGGRFDAAALAASDASRGTLFIDRVEDLGPRAQQALLAVLEPSGLVRTADGGELRLITSATSELSAAADAGTFAPDLYYGLTVLTVRLAPLRERPDDIPALSQMLAAELTVRLGRPPVVFTDCALDRLANYLWFGNLAELEAVLARTVALCRDAVIDADDLRFDPARVHPRGGRAAAAARHPSSALGGRPLDLIVNELAHEFKNPLVTIKTFAHHLRRALPSSGEEERMARLTGEAVAQIDQALENLLEFTRLETPVPQAVPLAAVLDRVLDECGPGLAARGVALDHLPAPLVAVRGDPQQLIYALGNLVRALTRELAPTSRLAVRYGVPAALIIELPRGTDPFASPLATLLGSAADGSPALPLGVAIANAVLERNGAQVALADRAASTVIVRFTPADDDAVIAGNGSSPRPDR